MERWGGSTNCHLKDEASLSPLPIHLLLKTLCEALCVSQDSNVCVCVCRVMHVLFSVHVNKYVCMDA